MGDMAAMTNVHFDDSFHEQAFSHYDDYVKVRFNYEHKNRETQKARLFGFAKSQVWIPKSQIKSETSTTLLIPEWLAERSGLI